MKSMICTQRTLLQLQAESKSYTVMDIKQQGLGVRVSPQGKKVYVVKARVHSRAHTQTLGLCLTMTVKEARQKCMECVALWQQGHQEIKQSPTFSAFIETVWLHEVFEHWKPSTQRMVKNVLKNQFMPKFGRRRLHLLTAFDVRQWFDDYSVTKAGGANRALDILQSIFKLAVVHGYVKINVCAGITQNPKRTLNRFLSLEEIRRMDEVMKTCTLQGGERERQCSDILRLLLLTGCRLSEIVTLKWSYIDKQEIHLPDSKTGARSVYLSLAAKEILSRQDHHTEFVFEQQDGRPQQGVPAYWVKVRQEANIIDVRIHDLRHTFASHAALLNETLPMIAKMLGHKRLSVTLRYTHVSQPETNAAAQRIGALIKNMAEGREACITPPRDDHARFEENKVIDMYSPPMQPKRVRIPLTVEELNAVMALANKLGETPDKFCLRAFRQQLARDLKECSKRELVYRIKAKISRLPKVKAGTRTEALNIGLPFYDEERYREHTVQCRVAFLAWARMAISKGIN